MWKQTAAVVFDLFGTLVPAVTPKMYRAAVCDVASALNLDPERVTGLWIGDHAFRASLLTSGTSTADQIGLTCVRLGAVRTLRERDRATNLHLQSHRAWMRPWHDSLETLRQLKDSGLHIGLISDCSISVHELWTETAFAPLVDCALFSCLEGATKPSRCLYERVSRRLGVDPAACLYLGDRLDELTGASDVGMSSVWMDSAGVGLSSEWMGAKVATPGEVVGFVSR